jgi:hypothetical protein
VGDGVLVGLRVGVLDEVTVAVADGVAEGVHVPVLVGDEVGVLELIGVAVAVGVQVGRVVGVLDGVEVAVAVRLGVLVGTEVGGRVSASANAPKTVV